MATPGGLFDPILVNASWFEDGQQTAAEWFDPSLAATPTDGSANLSASQTLASLTQTASLKVIVAASVAKTLATITQSNRIAPLVAASVSRTLATVTQTAGAKAVVTVAGSRTLANATQSAVAVAVVKLSAGQSLAAAVMSATAAVKSALSASQTLSGVGQIATATVVSDGSASLTAAQTLDGIVQTAAAAVIPVVSAATSSSGGGGGAASAPPARRRRAYVEWSRHITAIQQANDASKRAAAQRLDDLISETLDQLEERAVRNDKPVGLPAAVVAKAESLRSDAQDVARQPVVTPEAIARLMRMAVVVQEQLARVEAQIEEWEQDEEETVLLLAA